MEENEGEKKIEVMEVVEQEEEGRKRKWRR